MPTNKKPVLQEPFADIHGLEGLYVFVNHPARVSVVGSQYPIFQRLMDESSREIQEKRAQSVVDSVPRKRLVHRYDDSGMGHWDLVDDKTGEVLWSDDPDHKTNPIVLAMEYLQKNFKNLKTYTVMGEFVEWLQDRAAEKKKPACVGVSTCGGCDMSCPAHPDAKREKRTPEFYEAFYKSVTAAIHHLHQ
jgi:hypothetical protein